MKKYILIDSDSGQEYEVNEKQALNKIRYSDVSAVYREICGAENSKNRLFVNDVYDLKPQTTARLIALATYMGHDNNIRFQGGLFRRKNIEEAMHLNNYIADGFICAAKKNGYITQKGKSYFINTEYISKHRTHCYEYVIFGDNFRSMYLGTPTYKHMYIGYILQMTRFINRTWGVICHNPDETDFSKIIPMNAAEICRRLNKTVNTTEFFKNFADIDFMCGDMKQMLLYKCLLDGNQIYIVNPNIISGSVKKTNYISKLERS